MELQYLGTAAAEGFPAVFCNCQHCQDARRLGGKNIRTRSQAIINDDLLVDLPADTYMHFLNNDIEGDKIKYLLITHSHGDHLYPSELNVHGSVYGRDMRVDETKILCGTGAYEKLENEKNKLNVSVQIIAPFESVQLGAYTITALPARHAQGDGALIYIISDGEKTILYAHDTGYFYDDVFEFIENKGIKFDLISLDCTNVDIPIADEGNHMGIDNLKRVVARLVKIGAVSENTKKIINHFSHNGRPIHEELEERVSKDGYLVSYDGMKVQV